MLTEFELQKIINRESVNTLIEIFLALCLLMSEIRSDSLTDLIWSGSQITFASLGGWMVKNLENLQPL